MTIRILASTIILMLFAPVVRAPAGLVLSVSTSAATVVADGSGLGTLTIDVRAAADTGTQTLKSYDLFVDLAAPTGVGLPAGWSVSTPVAGATFPVFLPSTSPTAGDIGVSGSDILGPGITLTTTPTTLFQFTVSMNRALGAIDGAYSANFLTNLTVPAAANFGLADANNAPITNFTTNSATITLQGFAVPEPSVLSLISIVVAGASWRNRRRMA